MALRVGYAVSVRARITSALPSRSRTDNDRGMPPNPRWDNKRTTARNGGGLACRGRQVKCAAGGCGDGDRIGGEWGVWALGVGHSVPVWRG